MEIYLDTNAFYFFFFDNPEYSPSIRNFFNELKAGEHKAVTSCFTLEELAYVVLLRLIERKYKKHPKDVIRENRYVISEFSGTITEIFIEIYSIENLEITPTDKKDVWFIPQVAEENILLPRDSI